MTGNSNKTRAVILAALMVFSVFAGTVAFAGTAAAEEPSYGGNAVHYVTDSGDGDAVIEVPFEDGNVSDASLTHQNFTVLDDDDNITSDVVSDYRKQNASVIIELDRVVASNDLEVEISENVKSSSGDDIANPGEKSVVFAGRTLEFDGGFGGGGADVQDNSANHTVYQGVTIAVNSSNITDPANTYGFPGTAVTVEGEDNNYFTEGSTGNNSTVYTLDTSDRELGEYRIFVQDSDDSANRTFINVRDLELNVEVDDQNVTTDDTIESTVSAVSGGRQVNVELLDSSGDTLNETPATLDGQGERDVDFNTATADGNEALETGTYTVLVTDNATGVTVESSEVEVTEADDEDVNFADNALSTAQGDFFETTVEMTETSEATISFGSEEDGVVANATVEDDDGDDEVTVYVNTYAMQTGSDVFSLDSDSDDNILDQNNPTKTDDLIDAGDYDLEIEAGDAGVGTGVTDADDVATVTLEERSTDAFRMWTGSSEAISSISDLEDVNEALDEGQITESSDTAAGDYAIHQLEASGFEGALDARDNEDVTTAFQNLDEGTGPINLTIEEADPGANQDAKEVVKGYGDNVTVIADGPNDTYFVIVDTGSVNLADDQTGANAEAVPNDDDTELEANFTVLGDEDGATWDFTTNEDDENEETFVSYTVEEPEVNIDAPYNVSNAEGQTISGNTNIAPGTELTLRVRSQSGTSPSFLKTASPVVQSDGTWSATMDFSEQSIGDEYDITVSSSGIILASDETEEGEVVESVGTATPEPDTDTPEPDTDTPEPDTDTPEPDTDTPEPDTDTPEPDTETPTSTPGFGVVVALTALIAAALLAIRRD
ncbi:BGTF surface domain-containing protein [Halobellus ordinarius]|uniref:DUF7827 domain-containing protein n=1 Tax=Halobellus ordinarius TaxID=3075120 RepID=UPI0028801033|nr:BGTF surface domain-containing protein [Halobellus sp. ZY16]